MKKITVTVSVLLLVSLLADLVPAVIAQTGGTSLPQEIIVNPQERFRTLHHRANLAERKVFELFNAINDDDYYDVHCQMEAELGTRIKKQVCRPEFIDRATAEDASAYLDGRSSALPVSIATRHYPELEARMRKALISNPELQEAVIDHHYLREELNENLGSFFGEN